MVGTQGSAKLTTYIVVFDINPTEAVQPETSSSYFGSDVKISLISHIHIHHPGLPLRIARSVAKKQSLRACSKSFRLKASCLARIL